MANKRQDSRPFFDVMHEYQESLKEYTEAAMMLHVAVTTALRLVEQGADPKRALETLREHDDRYGKAAHGLGV